MLTKRLWGMTRFGQTTEIAKVIRIKPTSTVISENVQGRNKNTWYLTVVHNSFVCKRLNCGLKCQTKKKKKKKKPCILKKYYTTTTCNHFRKKLTRNISTIGVSEIVQL